MAAETSFARPRTRKGAIPSVRTRAPPSRQASLPMIETFRDKMAAETYLPPRSEKQAKGLSMRMRLSGRLEIAPNLMIQNGRRDVYGADDSRKIGAALPHCARAHAQFSPERRRENSRSDLSRDFAD
ncbi:hypothetical protein KIL84_009464 [Mauremys mutica]|uniref:Uncharacterized protein n=1 Tax=Mauremys mutica TaxID=74926 RepID=A0A9D3XXP3_9SAUR|nr:hypothetical protein KIL84_009464 [Mauremys mutica]